MTQKMNSIIKDEIAELRKILEDVKGAKFREDFWNSARQVLSKKQIESRKTALKKKAEQGLPSKDHHAVEVLYATTNLESSPIQVSIALDITVTEESAPKAPQSAVGHKDTIVWFSGLQRYIVNLPGATYEMGDTDESGSDSDDLDDRSGRRSLSGYSGTAVEVTADEQEMTAEGSVVSGV